MPTLQELRDPGVRGYWDADVLCKAGLSPWTIIRLLGVAYGEDDPDVQSKFMQGVHQRLDEMDNDPDRHSEWSQLPAAVRAE